MINVGVIGAGFAGAIHASAYAKVPDTRVLFIVDRNADRAEALAAQVGAQRITDIQALLDNPAIDLVDISVPTPLHTDLVVRALKAGKHVVVEKPLALTLSQADTILAAAEASQRFVMVGHVLRFWPEYEAIREVLVSERLGRPKLATALRLSNLPQWAGWFRDPQMTGGAVVDLHIHDLDLLNWLFGQPQRVFARGIQGETGGWDHVITQVEYERVTACAEASFLMPQDFPFTAGLRILCEGGVIEYHFRASGASFETGQPAHYLCLHEPGKPNQPIAFDQGDAFERELAYFVACVRDNQPPAVVTLADARLALQTALAARDSLETGQPIRAEV